MLRPGQAAAPSTKHDPWDSRSRSSRRSWLSWLCRCCRSALLCEAGWWSAGRSSAVIAASAYLRRAPIFAVADLFICAVGLLYHYGPFIRQRFLLLTPGAVFCVAVWLGLGLWSGSTWSAGGDSGRHTERWAAWRCCCSTSTSTPWSCWSGAEINSEMDFEVLKIRRGSSDFSHPADPGTASPDAM